MFQRASFTAQPSPHRSLSTALLPCLLLALFLTGCKSASTPTQPQAQAQSQTAESGTPQTESQTSSPVTGGARSASGDARSDDEIIGDFDSELDASIAVFDGMILEERSKAEAIEASLGGGNDGGESGDAGGAGGEGSLFEDGDIYEGLPGYGEFPDDAGEDEGDNQQASNAEGEAGDGTASTGGSNGTESAEGSSSSAGLETTRRGGIPEDIESGSDDDIVARQIREAALKEKDPALREKLWDEYRKYKNQ
ncbi:MAG: hypothetical protein DRQ64_00620 [Gammaproteobacteria bacterium]|nr:MAG: hypothetical protein DRQ64_00620 [Gammaproteobacteria bacterium]